tara:strand:+ start:293 stop:733 length:441 start_codon:yes stop_codon:yes gene_type:complete
MPKGMHLVLGMTSLDTRKKKKPKITKKRMEQLVEEHRLYNKACKQTNNRRDMMSFDDYVKRQFGQVKYKPKKTGTYQPTDMIITRNTNIPNLTIDVKDLQHACTKPNDDYKKEISSQYVIGQAYNKSGLQVLTKRETQDPATGKRR